MINKSQIEKNRAEKDRFFSQHHQSPLPNSEKQDFSGLDYYPIKEKYHFELPLQEYDEKETIEMETNDGQQRKYRRIGYLEFEIDGQTEDINVYQSTSNPDHYFVPFRDKTSGKETYPAGRYLDIEKENGKFELDFNKAYNPFCAYSDRYSCPLPPAENWLQIPINAGEKKYYED